MKKPEGTEKLEGLKEQLYARDGGARMRTRRGLSGGSGVVSKPAPREWTPPEKERSTFSREGVKQVIDRQKTAISSITTGLGEKLDPEVYSKYMPYQNKSRRYRGKLLIAGIAFFGLALALSSMFLLFGNNSISGDNISLEVDGPFAVGGGEEISLQIAVRNDNTVPIESATLIIEYPLGTQSSESPGQELFTDRRQLNVVEPGELLNVPVKAIIFGEENSEKTINVSVEYRVRGSNALFVKKAEPLRLKISSSPVAMLIDSVTSVTSGQETEIKLTIGSNSPTELTDVLVQAVYPIGFDLSSAEPQPASGQNTWLIESLDPEEKTEIVIKGVMTGNQDETKVFDFSVGVPNERDRYTLASVYTTGKAEIDLEGSFVGVEVEINGQDDETIVLQSGEAANVRVFFRNTLSDTIYNGEIDVVLGGNALSDVQVNAQGGFYDSARNTVRYDGGNESSLKEILPGESSSVAFTIEPENSVSRTPEITLAVNIRGERVSESNVSKELKATASRTIRVGTSADISSALLYETGPFDNTGPIPPVAEKTTQYTLQFSVKNGSNELTGGEMTAVLPQYVTWLGAVSSGDQVTYDAVNRTMTWKIGDITANATESMSAQIGMTPSQSQIDKIPTILETQRFKATDRFTGAVIRDEASALTTVLSDDDNEANGRVRED